jgi:hypothetical protein
MSLLRRAGAALLRAATIRPAAPAAVETVCSNGEDGFALVLVGG